MTTKVILLIKPESEHYESVKKMVKDIYNNRLGEETYNLNDYGKFFTIESWFAGIHMKVSSTPLSVINALSVDEWDVAAQLEFNDTGDEGIIWTYMPDVSRNDKVDYIPEDNIQVLSNMNIEDENSQTPSINRESASVVDYIEYDYGLLEEAMGYLEAYDLYDDGIEIV